MYQAWNQLDWQITIMAWALSGLNWKAHGWLRLVQHLLNDSSTSFNLFKVEWIQTFLPQIMGSVNSNTARELSGGQPLIGVAKLASSYRRAKKRRERERERLAAAQPNSMSLPDSGNKPILRQETRVGTSQGSKVRSKSKLAPSSK